VSSGISDGRVERQRWPKALNFIDDILTQTMIVFDGLMKNLRFGFP
jgi:hypothetical protein